MRNVYKSLFTGLCKDLKRKVYLVWQESLSIILNYLAKKLPNVIFAVL